MAGKSWTYFPNRQQIRRTCPQHMYDRAGDAVQNDEIESARMTGSTITINVRARNQTHAVVLTYDNDGTVFGDCNCSDGRKNLWCWHYAAALVYTADHIDELKEEEETRTEAVDYFMANLPQARVLNFVSKHLRENPQFYDSFVEALKLQNVRIPRNYSKMMERIYADDRTGGEEDNVIFGRIFKIARDERDSGGHLEAARAYSGMAEHIISNMKNTEDANGYYKDCAVEAIDSMVDSIICENMKPDKKKPYIKYFFKRAVNTTYRVYWPQYVEALETICTEEEDMAGWLEMINKGMSSKAGAPVQMARMRSHILEDAGRWEEAADALSDHYASDPDVCRRFVGILRHVEGERALEDARKAVAAFRTDTAIMEEALPIFASVNDEYQQLLVNLFESTGDWKYFFKIKEVADDWNNALDHMSKNLAPKAPERAVEIYLKESMRQKAMDTLERLDSHDTYAKYLSKLAKKFPDRYFESYGNNIRRLAKARTGKDHYERVRVHLQNLLSIPESEDRFRALVASIKSENSGRRTLLKALEGL